MQLVLALFSIVVVGIENSFQKVYSDAEYLEDKCTVQSTDNYHTRLACGAVVICRPKEMSISLPKALLATVAREDLRLLDSNCTATENATHFVLTTSLIGCGTFNRHTDSSVIYSNKVRQVYSETVIITRAPEIQISFSCHYSRHGLVSTGAIRGKDTEDNFEPEDNHCWKNRFLLYRRFPSCPVESTDRTIETRLKP
nr:uncharacterized protein LOC131800068 [Pocillopora verrucosa]